MTISSDNFVPFSQAELAAHLEDRRRALRLPVLGDGVIIIESASDGTILIDIERPCHRPAGFALSAEQAIALADAIRAAAS